MPTIIFGTVTFTNRVNLLSMKNIQRERFDINWLVQPMKIAVGHVGVHFLIKKEGKIYHLNEHVTINECKLNC